MDDAPTAHPRDSGTERPPPVPGWVKWLGIGFVVVALVVVVVMLIVVGGDHGPGQHGG